MTGQTATPSVVVVDVSKEMPTKKPLSSSPPERPPPFVTCVCLEGERERVTAALSLSLSLTRGAVADTLRSAQKQKRKKGRVTKESTITFLRRLFFLASLLRTLKKHAALFEPPALQWGRPRGSQQPSLPPG